MQFARECAIDIPGPETDALGKLARQWDAYVIATAKVRHPEFKDRFFNVGFVIEPEDGTVILRHHKVVPLQPVEHSVTPHNVWDRWIELYGAKLESFYPVADTEIGRIGIMMANEVSYPENARGLAMNGCEIAYRGPYPAPGVMSGMFGVQNRARALDNNMYVIAMNLGTYLLDSDSTVPIDTFSGGSQIVDYRGQIVTEVPYGGGSTWIAGTIDIEALRHFRQTAQQWGQLAEGPDHGAVPADLRAPDLSQEPVPEAEAVHPRPVPGEGHAQTGRTAAEARNLESAHARGRGRGVAQQRRLEHAGGLSETVSPGRVRSGLARGAGVAGAASSVGAEVATHFAMPTEPPDGKGKRVRASCR